MERLKVILLLVGFFLYAIPSSYGISASCMRVYEKGGAPYVFESPECPHWVLSPESLQNQTMKCQSATLQGQRKYQEDRILCDLDVQIPIVGKNGLKDVTVGIAAVFDGHGGKEASEMASKLFMDYFRLHIVFNTFKRQLTCKEEYDMVSQVHKEDGELERHILNIGSSKGVLPVNVDESIHMEILKDALLRTIHDIDLTFSKVAVRDNLVSGSTAVIVLTVDGHILVANVGDSKALLCSEKIQSRHEATELTRDHHPDRDDERSRVEASGGSVIVWGVPRVNGVLAMSRSIGDVYLKRYGVISVPEVTGWRPLTVNDSYLVVASDGVFEGLTAQDVCDVLWYKQVEGSKKSELLSSCLPSFSLAECIVNTALEAGSMDNLSAIVVPLRSAGFQKNSMTRSICF